MSEATYKDSWSGIDHTADPEYWVRFMDSVHQGREEYPDANMGLFEMLHVQEGHQVLDVGCGAGGVTRAVSYLVKSSGRAVGLDRSETMIAVSRQRSEGKDLPVEFMVGDVYALPFPNDSFDGCFALNIFEVLDYPRQALSEMVRVTRRGGRVVGTAPDYGTLAIDASDRTVTRKLLNYICDYETCGWIGRQLQGLFHSLELVDIAVEPSIGMLRNFAQFYDLWLCGYLERAQAAGAVTADEARAWLSDVEESSRQGRFFTAHLNFLVCGRKP